MKRVVKIKWATDLVIQGQDEVTGEIKEYPARGPHRCVKDRDHIYNSTDDDHQCCCGNSDWVS